MVTGSKGEQARNAARRDQEAVEALVKDKVLQALGKPSEPYEVRVRRLWADRYRVNVVVGADPHGSRIAHSYFLVSDEAGNILEASPCLTRQY
jgi:hypothetical protein